MTRGARSWSAAVRLAAPEPERPALDVAAERPASEREQPTASRTSVRVLRASASASPSRRCESGIHCLAVHKLTVTVITRNEAANIAAALESVRWADEIVVVDSESTDDTVDDRAAVHRQGHRPPVARLRRAEELRRRAGEPRLDSLARRRRARDAGAGRARSARCLAASPPPPVTASRASTFHFGRWIRSTDWYPDYQLRLYDRRRARWAGRYVHESVRADGPVEQLRGELQHYAYRDIAASPADDGSLHDAGGAADVRGRPARQLDRHPDHAAAGVLSQLHPSRRLPRRHAGTDRFRR